MPTDSTCPDGQPHVWKIPSSPDPTSGLYPSECSRCHRKKDFTSNISSTHDYVVTKSNRPKKHEKKPPSFSGKVSKRRSHGFPDRDVMRAREQEYLSRKPEIIASYVAKGSAYGAAKQLGIPESSLRQLLKRWDTDVKKYIKEQNAPPGTIFSKGEIISLNVYGDHVLASIKVDPLESRKGNLRLGTVEMRCPESAL